MLTKYIDFRFYIVCIYKGELVKNMNENLKPYKKQYLTEMATRYVAGFKVDIYGGKDTGGPGRKEHGYPHWSMSRMQMRENRIANVQHWIIWFFIY